MVVGPIKWFEIYAANPERAKAFYSELFGWTFSREPAQNEDYWVIDTGKESLRGGLQYGLNPCYPALGTVLYVQVDDIQEFLSKARRLGAEIIRPKTLISDSCGYFAMVQDLDNNAVGVWSAS